MPSLTARCAAAAVAIVATGVLCGWAFAIPLLTSLVPGAVEMKVNTAIALLLSATALFLTARRSTASVRYAAWTAALIVVLIGLLTLLEYALHWRAGIDEALFKDTRHAFNAIPGRMSPFSAVAFIAIGVALTLAGLSKALSIVRITAAIASAIGFVSLLGYVWDASELTTDQWIPPVAVHTAAAFILLGVGTLLAARKPDKARARSPVPGRGRVEVKVLCGFILALVLFCIGGDITYRMQASQSRAGELLVASQQARTALGATCSAISDAESAERNYMLTGNRVYRDQYLAAVRRAAEQFAKLPNSGLDTGVEQRASLQKLRLLIPRRMNAFARHLEIFERDGEAAVRSAIATDGAVQIMSGVRATIAAMDAREAALASDYTRQLTRDRSYTLIALLGTLMTATATLLVLFGIIVRDIAERAQINAALARAQKEAQNATDAKSQFLAAMSHEIRTPMNGVVGMVELLEQSSLLEPQQQMVQLIRESAHSLLTIINDILDFSKIEAGRFEIEHLPLSLHEVVEGACGLLNRLAERQKTVLTVFCDPAIPSHLLGDAMRLRQVIVNLANNAIKFSGGMERPGRVAVRARLLELTKGRAVIEVRVVDNGIGMDLATRARLFTSFMQSDASTTRRYGGTGLGLVISKQLVELMGGTISVDTELGHGSTFTLRLAFEIAPDPAQEIAQTPLLSGLSCLVVGGEGGLADDLAAYLGSDGASVGRIAELSRAEDWTRAHATGLAVWVLEVANELPSLETLISAIKISPGSDIRVVMVVLGRGQRNAHAEASGFVMVDGNALSRDALIGAVGAAAGRFPAEAKRGNRATRGERPPLATRSQACGERRLILVAEDNEINQRLITEQLNLLGHTADIVANGREALRQWHTGDYALMFVDLHMPEMDGYDLTLAVRLAEADKHTKRMPIIALTANALAGEAERCRAVGMDEYLTKPASLETLDAAVKRWMPRAGIVTATPTERSAVDVRALEALIGSDPMVVKSFLDHFSVSAAQSGVDLTAACNARQPRQAAAAAHKLKSAARSVGAERLAVICADIEAAGTDNALERVLALLPVFDAELQAVQAALRLTQPQPGAVAQCA